MKKFMDRKQGKGKEYRVGDLVLLSMKNLKWQMKGRRSEKLIEHFVGPYKIKGIISSNAERMQKGIAHWDKQNHAVPAPNCVLKVQGEIIKDEGL